MTGKLQDRVAVVTGAARGLGRAAAIRLASEGANVEIVDIQDAAPVIGEIAAGGGQATAIECDCTDEEQIGKAVALIGSRRGRVDILVNNAGMLPRSKPWHTLTKEEVNRYVEVNYVGQFLMTKALYPLIKKSKTPRIIMVASRTYFLANPGHMAYVASKAALMGMTRVLARELGAEGIPVNAIVPSMVATPGTAEYADESDFAAAVRIQAIPKRVQPEHLAGLIAFLASDDAELITGQTILCDGGGYLH
jgi:NAD(P)-dependent dehydrogenase (short-subunit alcohol dehydrogenase family)